VFHSGIKLGRPIEHETVSAYTEKVEVSINNVSGYGLRMNKFAKSLALAVLVVVSFGVSSQSASARVVLPLDGICPSGSPIRTQVDSSLVCLSLDEYCPTNNQWFMDYDSPLKCPDYQNNPEWIRYVAATTTVPSSGGSVTTTVPSSGGSVTTTVPSSGGSSSNSVSRTTTTTIEVPVVEDDGESEDDFADIGLSSKDGKFNIRVSSSFGETEMILRAYKKNSKSVTWSFTTYSSGSYRILTSRALKGFTVSLWIDGEKWDSLVVR
jgi:hypothetical protein